MGDQRWGKPDEQLMLRYVVDGLAAATRLADAEAGPWRPTETDPLVEELHCLAEAHVVELRPVEIGPQVAFRPAMTGKGAEAVAAVLRIVQPQSAMSPTTTEAGESRNKQTLS